MVTTRKLKTGVPGLDEILLGGILEGESVLVEGLPGTGKTTLGLHFILQGVAEGEAGLIITFEEFPAQYYRDALNFGWDLKQLEQDKKLKLIMTSPRVLSQELERPGGLMDQLTHELGIRRVLVDSINFLYRVKEQHVQDRDLINRFINGFKRQGVTSFLIKDIEGEDISPWGMYSVDCYIRLAFDLVRDYQRRRLIEVFKARGQRHLHGQHPFEITEEGVEVYPAALPNQISIATASDVSALERIGSGVQGLDGMLGGGFFKGQSVLVTGPSGTGKTNLALSFLAEGLKNNETVLYFSMEEMGNNLLRHARSLGMLLDTAVREERLTLLNIPSAGLSEGEFLHLLRKKLNELRPSRLVIDPINFLNTVAASSEMVHLTFQTMIRILREAKVTTICTSEISEVVGDFKLTDYNYLVDTVILLRLAEIETTLRKAVMIIKQRGSEHDRNLRELLIDSNGVRIGEPFSSYEGIFTGQTRRRSDGDPAKILVVDDDLQMIELIKASFRDERFTLLSCADGETALQLTITEAPDLIILDLMLPKINGFEVCQRLKADKSTADIPVILLSAKGETESKVHGIKIGADDYITKPFSPQELVARVKMILRRVCGKRQN
ncbi:response regulator [candidate division FCPU426 bacterium]|nr:response regulator [candidate division FCPU426 bacterium]